MDNEYLRDGCRFLKKAVGSICDGIGPETLPDVVLGAALGLERLLKAVLFDLNPVYVFNKQDFKNTAPILHSAHLTTVAEGSKEIAKKPDADVLSFRAALVRAVTVSQVIADHKNFLHAVSGQRDIVAHCLLSQLNDSVCHNILERDLFPFLCDFATQMDVARDDLFGSHETRFHRLSIENQEDVEARVNSRLEFYAKECARITSKPDYNKRKIGRQTSVYADRIDASGEAQIAKVICCPACGNKAVVSLCVEFDFADGGGYPSNAFVDELRCFYCGLHIELYDEIDFLNLDDEISWGDITLGRYHEPY